MAAKKEHYVNNKEFLEAMKAYKKSVNKAKREKLKQMIEGRNVKEEKRR